MQKTIAYSELPQWAKNAIDTASQHGQVQFNSSAGSLVIQNGIATYNGIEVAEATTFDTLPEEVLLASTLPNWAQKTIREERNSYVQMDQNGQTLQITPRSILYNNKKVVDDLWH